MRDRRWTIEVCPVCDAIVTRQRPDDVPVCFGRGVEHERAVAVPVEVAPACAAMGASARGTRRSRRRVDRWGGVKLWDWGELDRVREAFVRGEIEVDEFEREVERIVFGLPSEDDVRLARMVLAASR